jgi:hypothetical protein
MVLEVAPVYGRPVPLDKLSRDFESIAAEVIEMRDGIVEAEIPEVTKLTFYAGDLNPMSGSPGQSTLANLGVVPSWGLAKSAVMTVGVMTELPSTWVTYNITLLGAPRDGTGGDVAFRHVRSNGGVGDTFASGSITGSVVTHTVGTTAGILQSVALATGLAVPSAGDYVGIQIARRVAEASDNYTGTFDLAAVLITKAS